MFVFLDRFWKTNPLASSYTPVDGLAFCLVAAARGFGPFGLDLLPLLKDAKNQACA